MKFKILIATLLIFLSGISTTQAALININTVYDNVANVLQQIPNAVSAKFKAASFTATSTSAYSTFASRIGIATTTPTTALSVVGTTTSSNLLVSQAGRIKRLFIGENTTNAWKIATSTLSSNTLLFTNSAYPSVIIGADTATPNGNLTLNSQSQGPYTALGLINDTVKGAVVIDNVNSIGGISPNILMQNTTGGGAGVVIPANSGNFSAILRTYNGLGAIFNVLAPYNISGQESNLSTTMVNSDGSNNTIDWGIQEYGGSFPTGKMQYVHALASGLTVSMPTISHGWWNQGYGNSSNSTSSWGYLSASSTFYTSPLGATSVVVLGDAWTKGYSKGGVNGIDFGMRGVADGTGATLQVVASTSRSKAMEVFSRNGSTFTSLFSVGKTVSRFLTSVAIGTSTSPANLTVYNNTNSASNIMIATAGTTTNQQSALDLVTKANGQYLGTATNKGWSLFGRGNAFTTTVEQNDLGFSYWNGATYTTPLWLESLTGNVGIGTTTPSKTLSVAGDIRLTGALFDRVNSAGTKGMVFQTTGTSTRWVATSTLGLGGGGGGSSKWSDAGSGYLNPLLGEYVSAPRFVATSTTEASSVAYRLGIGTTTPTTALSVVGTTTSTGLSVTGLTSRAYFAGKARFGNFDQALTSTNVTIQGTLSTASSMNDVLTFDRPFNSGVFRGRRASISVGAFDATSVGPTRLDFNLGTAGITSATDSALPTTAVMTLVGNSRVGINTTAPSTALHVVGTTTLATTTTRGLTVTGTASTTNLVVSNTATTSNLSFMGELKPDGALCTNGQILKKTGANDWDCATDATGGGGGTWDTIGDAVANGAVGMAEFVQTLDWDTGAVTSMAGDYFTLTSQNDATTDVSTQRLFVLENKALSTNAMEVMQRITNSDAVAVVTGLLIDGTGAFTTAIDVSASAIVTALSAGANDLTGTNWSIAGTTGLLSTAGGLTLSGSTANISLGTNYLSGDGGDEGVYVTAAGLVGIATTTPAVALSVVGEGRFSSNLTALGNLVLTGATAVIQRVAITEPSAPATGNMLTYAKNIAGKLHLFNKNPLGQAMPSQDALWNSSVIQWRPTTVTAGLWVQTVGAGAGTFANTLPSNSTIYTQQKRALYSNVVTTVNQVLGQRTTESLWWRGDTAGEGGYFVCSDFGFTTWTNGGRAFFGLHTTTGVVSGDPSGTSNVVGFAVDSADNGAISFLTRETTTATKASTGFTIVSGKGYKACFRAAPNDTKIDWWIKDINAGTEASGSATANLPANTTFLTLGTLASNGALTPVNSTQLGVANIYAQTDY